MKIFRSAIYRLVEDCRSKHLFLFGCNDYAKKIAKKLELLDIHVKGFVTEEPLIKTFCNATVYSISEFKMLGFPAASYVIIILHENQGAILEKYGFRRNIDFRTINYNIALRQEYTMDPNIGYNHDGDDGLVGFKKFSTGGNNPVIVALGNSTTDAWQFPFKSWPEYLYDFCCENEMPATVLDGGVSGHMSPQETIKLMRDVLPMQPKAVICFEGFQDVHMLFRHESYPFILNYQKEWLESQNIDRWIDIYYTKGVSFGIDGHQTSYQLWKHSMRCMHALCAEFGIAFFGILQPSVFNSLPHPGKKDWEVLLHCEVRDDYLKCFEGFFREYWGDTWKPKYIYDFTDIFCGIDGLYIDTVHVKPEGNKIIAKNVFELIKAIL